MHLSKWDKRFFTLASEVASWSKDPNKQVGAVAISADKRRISYGYNGFPSAIQDTEQRLSNKEVKNSLSLHAEVNAILNAKENLAGWTIYCSEAICANCALIIIQAGVTKVVMPAIKANSTWKDSCERAIIMFNEANVELTLINEIPYYV